MNKKNLSLFFFGILTIICFTPISSSALGLFSGVLFSFFFINPFASLTKKYSSLVLQTSVVLLGATMNLSVLKTVGASGVKYTFIGILATFILGHLLNKIFNINKNISHLMTIGTAICGGSAIAALSPIINAKNEEISLSLAIVFILNACALFIFPLVGHEFNLSQYQFGLWSALAIHDTSSVVGASMSYGKEALFYATTIKLARALWILPVCLIISFFIQSKKSIKIPWFIFYFILLSAVFTFLPQLNVLGNYLGFIAKKLLVFSLFLIGLNINLEAIKGIGPKPLVFGVTMWLVVAFSSLMFVKYCYV